MTKLTDVNGQMKDGAVGANVRLGFVSLVILLLASAGFSYYNTRQLFDNSSRVAWSNEILDSLSEIHATMKDVESGQRGYLITGEKEFLNPYECASLQIRPKMERIHTLFAESPEHAPSVKSLEKKIEGRLALVKQLRTLREEKGIEAAQEFVAAGHGQRAMEEIRILIEEMKSAQREPLQQLGIQSARSHSLALLAEMLALLLGLALLGLSFFLVRREQSAHHRTMQALDEQREWLRVTLTSIGDAVIVTDVRGVITFLNPVAGSLTGWNQDAVGKHLTEVFHVKDEATRQPLESPLTRVLREEKAVRLIHPTLLMTKAGAEIAIDDSAAPIRDRDGKIAGVVLVFRNVTERKHSEQALRRSEQELTDFFENATVALHWVGPDGIILRANAAELALLGYARDEYVGRSIVDFHADPGAIEEILYRLKAGEVVNDYEARLRCKDGSIKHVLINSSALWLDGKFIRTRCFTRDITGRKRVEDALRTSEVRYRRLFETARNAILILDGDTGAIIDCNPSATELTGYDRPALTGKQLWEIGVFETMEVNRSALRQIREQGTIRYGQLSVGTEAGVRADAECVAVAYEMDNKEFIQFGIHDISSRVRAEEALRAARDRFRSVVDHVVHGIISIDESGLVESVNPAAERLFGYQAAEVVGQNFKMLLHEPYHSEHEAYLANFGRADQTEIFGLGREVVGLRKDGTTFPMELDVSTFPLGQRRLFTGIVQDITERKRMEEQLRERVAQLRDADRRKNEFLAMLAHELRNPLAPVQNAVHLLRKNCPQDPETTWAYDVIDRQVQHMTRMVDDLLDVSRITRGLINLQKEPIDIATVVARAVELAQPLIDARKHQFIVTLPPEPLRLEADLPRLAQVLANLLNNAAKYTEEAGTIWLTVERQDSDALIKVRDTGIGIPSEYLPHVFELFSQEDSSLERTHGGLGIGLTLVRILVKMHGGVIQAFSAGAGQGSEFVLRLPALADGAAEPPPEVSKAEPTPALSAPRRILVVDDNVDGARSLSTLLRQDGHEVHTANDGFAALEIARKTPPDIALLDIGMPHMSGLEVARRLRGELGLTNILLVAMTGYGQDEDRHRSHEAGFNVHMVKPVDLEALQDLLARSQPAQRA